ncbi:tetratricopeptide repeat protein [candidate division KSB1 bacterium]|nr:tetratricopeptide repeat protein [candidate division KSB1 bacterium]
MAVFRRIVFLIIILFVSNGFVFTQTPSQLYQHALLKENGEGDLNAAISLYEKVVADTTADRSLRAKAHLHIGMCWEKMGEQQARSAYQLIIQQYADQSEIVNIAKERLASLQLEQKSSVQDSVSENEQWTGATITFAADMRDSFHAGVFDPQKHLLEIGGHFNGFQHGDTLHSSADDPLRYECDIYMNYRIDLYIQFKFRALPPFEFDEGGWEKGMRHFNMPARDIRMYTATPDFYPRRLPSFTEAGYAATSFCRGINAPTALAFRSNDELLVSNKNGYPGAGVFVARRGEMLNVSDLFAKPGDSSKGPDDIIIAPSGEIFLCEGTPGIIYKTSPAGGEPQLFITRTTIGSKYFNAYAAAIAPPGYDGRHVNPGDLIAADNGSGFDARGVWAINLKTGVGRVIVSGKQQFINGLIAPAFNSKAELFIMENTESGKGRIVKVTRDGKVIPVVVNIPESGSIVIHPVTDDIYFQYRVGEIYRLRAGAQTPELFASELYSFGGMIFSPDGRLLFICCNTWEEIMEITGPFAE